MSTDTTQALLEQVAFSRDFEKAIEEMNALITEAGIGRSAEFSIVGSFVVEEGKPGAVKA